MSVSVQGAEWWISIHRGKEIITPGIIELLSCPESPPVIGFFGGIHGAG
jgi:hypothetical protein